MLFKAKDWNRLSSDEDLGFVHVPATDLIQASGEILQYKLVPPSDVPRNLSAGDAGSLSIRTRPATESDLKKFGGKKAMGLLGGLVGKAKSQVHDLQSHAHDMSSKMKDHITSSSSSPTKKMMNPFQSAKNVVSSSKILVEIVACKDLLVADQKTNSSDPYCKVYLGKKEIHKTKNRTQT